MEGKQFACIEDQGIIDRILTHLRDKRQDISTLQLLLPTTSAPPGTLPFFAGSGSTTTTPGQHGNH
jgi:hypothetical protein